LPQHAAPLGNLFGQPEVFIYTIHGNNAKRTVMKMKKIANNNTNQMDGEISS